MRLVEFSRVQVVFCLNLVKTWQNVIGANDG